MSIQKKSLISTLKTAKKANVASDVKSEKMPNAKTQLSGKAIFNNRVSFKTLKSAKTASPRVL